MHSGWAKGDATANLGVDRPPACRRAGRPLSCVSCANAMAPAKCREGYGVPDARGATQLAEHNAPAPFGETPRDSEGVGVLPATQLQYSALSTAAAARTALALVRVLRWLEFRGDDVVQGCQVRFAVLAYLLQVAVLQHADVARCAPRQRCRPPFRHPPATLAIGCQRSTAALSEAVPRQAAAPPLPRDLERLP